jgi:hypothetical protein
VDASVTFTRFFSSLFEGSEAVVVPPPAGDLDFDLGVFLEVDRAWQLNAPFSPPVLHEASARWATRIVFRAAQCLVYREVPAEQVGLMLAEACPAETSPTVCRSVDVAMRALPDLLALTRGVSMDDPLVIGMMSLAKAWPLSSVGVPGLVGPFPIEAFASDRCLMALYVDRIIAARDTSRLDDPRVARCVGDALGAFGSTLAPQMAMAWQGAMGKQDLSRTNE